MVVGGVKAAVAAAAGQGPANEDQRRPGDASLLCLVADIAERAAYQLLVRPADAIGDDRRAIRAVMRQTRARLAIERWITSVAPLAARWSRRSPSGIAEARVAVRVRITVCATPGSVSSRPSAAAAAAKAGTPGVTSNGMPRASRWRICSALAP